MPHFGRPQVRELAVLFFSNTDSCMLKKQRVMQIGCISTDQSTESTSRNYEIASEDDSVTLIGHLGGAG